MGRAPCCEKVGLKKGRWSAEEDAILASYIKANGEGSWRSLPKNAGLLRCGKSCRLRWINYLRDDLKRGNFSAEEEETIVKLHSSLGNRWSLIAAHLPGRTDNEIKNYWNSHLSRRIHSFRRPNVGDGAPVIMELGRLAGMGRRRRGGRTNHRPSTKKKINAAVNGRPTEQIIRIGPAGLSTNQEGPGDDAGGAGTSMARTAQLITCDSPRYASSMAVEGQPEGSELLDGLDLWEWSGTFGSELFCGGETVDGFLASSAERRQYFCRPADELESGGFSANSSQSDDGEPGSAMSSTRQPKGVVAAGAAGGVEAAAGVHTADHLLPGAGRREFGTPAVAMELEELTAGLWNDVSEPWAWKWPEDAMGSELEAQRLIAMEGCVLDDTSWFFSDIM